MLLTANCLIAKPRGGAGGALLGELPAVVGGLWGDTHKVGFCIWSIFECVIVLTVCVFHSLCNDI